MGSLLTQVELFPQHALFVDPGVCQNTPRVGSASLSQTRQPDQWSSANRPRFVYVFPNAGTAFAIQLVYNNTEYPQPVAVVKVWLRRECRSVRCALVRGCTV